MQWKWKAWLQMPHATVHSSLMLEAWLAWHSMHGSMMRFRQMAQLSTTMSQAHNATAFHFFTSNLFLSLVTVEGEESTSMLTSSASCSAILSYILIKTVRTKAREILLHISIMDLTYSVANLIGASVDFNKRLKMQPYNENLVNLCIADAWFAMYGTTGSVLWTINLAVYLYFKVITLRLHPRSRMMRVLTFALYIVGYGFPICIAFYFYILGLLGPNEIFSSGWCTINIFNPHTGEKQLLPYVVGYDMWMYFALVLIPVLVMATKYQIESSEGSKKKTGTSHIVPVVKSSWRSVEMKLMAIPVIFLALRIWSICIGIIFIYSDAYCWIDARAIKALTFLSGIGDSGQGFFNGILFVILTKSVRESFLRLLLRPCTPKPKGTLFLADARFHNSPVGPPSSSIP